MGQNPSWQANSPTGRSQISLISSNLNVHHHIVMNWTPSPNQRHTNIVQVPHTSMNVKFNIILLSMPRLAMWSLKLRVLHKIPVTSLLASILSTWHADPTPLHQIPQTTVGELCRSISLSICILRLANARCSHLNPNIPPLLLDTLTLEYPFLNFHVPHHQVPHICSLCDFLINSGWT